MHLLGGRSSSLVQLQSVDLCQAKEGLLFPPFPDTQQQKLFLPFPGSQQQELFLPFPGSQQQDVMVVVKHLNALAQVVIPHLRYSFKRGSIPL